MGLIPPPGRPWMPAPEAVAVVFRAPELRRLLVTGGDEPLQALKLLMRQTTGSEDLSSKLVYHGPPYREGPLMGAGPS